MNCETLLCMHVPLRERETERQKTERQRETERHRETQRAKLKRI